MFRRVLIRMRLLLFKCPSFLLNGEIKQYQGLHLYHALEAFVSFNPPKLSVRFL